eukprot:CAMPEP_0183702028 /NCGR_PEP_ID=MMETSP0737-20130205/263_1 /TAXON_ID=385413 /ORGANISM="Thalassiosira miniscula, Strain CCMP1093" /LENGTH=454 /DNA_ID=CAMNT_0025928561 /DNA_START=216 /DNA_END=1580 /DNA_ORIENTATION=-
MGDRFKEWAEEYAGDIGCFEFYMMKSPQLVVCSEERLMELIPHRPDNTHRNHRIREAVNSLGATGLFTAEGQEWKREHKLVAAALNKNNVQDYMSTMKRMTERLLEKWSADSEEGVVQIYADLNNLSADSIANVSMGRDFRFLRTSDDDAPSTTGILDIGKAFDGLGVRALSPIRYWRIPFIGQYLDAYGAPAKRINRFITGVVEDHESSNGAGSKNTFLEKLFLVMKSEKATLNRGRVVGNVTTLFAAGTDTTSKALTTAMYLLAEDSKLQHELREEACFVDLNGIALKDMYRRLPRLKSFLHEVHRVYGPPLIGLKTRRDDIKFAGTTLPRGTNIFVLLNYISNHKSNHVPIGPSGKEPDQFCPYRFLQYSANGDLSCSDPNNKSGAFLGFGFGARKCPGRTYSEVLSYLVLVSVLKTFEWKLAPDHPEVKFHNDVVICPACEIQLTMTKLK